MVSRGAGLIDVFVRGTDNQLYTKWFNAGGWSAWTPMGGALKGDPTVASWSVTRLDVFGRGTDDRLYQQIVEQRTVVGVEEVGRWGHRG